MSIKEIRESAGLTQKDFAERYHIPLQTLKQWESAPESSSYRKPPDYVTYILNELVEKDSVAEDSGAVSRAEYLINAADETRYNAVHWLRYLRKIFDGDTIKLTSEQLMTVLSSDRLTSYQRLSLMRAATPGTETHDYVVGLNEHAHTPMIDEIMRRRRDV